MGAAAAVVALSLLVLATVSAQADSLVCNSVPGLCSVPIKDVTFLGTHNSLAVYDELSCPLRRQFSNQAAPALSQIAAGARALNIDADLRSGRVAFVHGICTNTKSTPEALFDGLGRWLAANPSETLLLHFDDNGKKDDPAAAEGMRSRLEAAMSASVLGPALYSGPPLSPDTPLSEVRGKAVVIFDAPQWNGGGARSSRGEWIKAWGEAEGRRLYAESPGAANNTAVEVARQLLSKLSGDAGAWCGSLVPFRSFSLGSADWKCNAGAGLRACQLPLLADATNSYEHIAGILRSASQACRNGGGGGVGPPGSNVVFLDYFPPTTAGAAGGAGASMIVEAAPAAGTAAAAGTAGTAAAQLPAARLVEDLNRAAALRYSGCEWAAGGGGSGLLLRCPGFPEQRPAVAAGAPAGSEDGAGAAASVAPAAEAPQQAGAAAADGSGGDGSAAGALFAPLDGPGGAVAAGGGSRGAAAQVSGTSPARACGGMAGALAAAAAAVLLARITSGQA